MLLVKGKPPRKHTRTAGAKECRALHKAHKSARQKGWISAWQRLLGDLDYARTIVQEVPDKYPVGFVSAAVYALNLPRRASATVVFSAADNMLPALLGSEITGEPWGWLPVACLVLGINTLLVLLLVAFLCGFGSGRGCLGACARRSSRALVAFFSPEIKDSSRGRRHVGTMGPVHYTHHTTHPKYQADTQGFRRAWEVTVDE